MKLRNPELLVAYMDEKKFSQARLARYAGVSRQFIHMLTTGQKTTCRPEVGGLIEEALGLLKGTLFDPKESPPARPAVVRPRTTHGAALAATA
ncbi:helix-turn-helix domain-containing protein [Cellulosimicrobium funkei]|uniref:helix-turn-helix domain-containing protein n=1 Tax=Cellulosimicrobium funkei TaxID=264251 RepID=UPI003666CB7B